MLLCVAALAAFSGAGEDLEVAHEGRDAPGPFKRAFQLRHDLGLVGIAAQMLDDLRQRDHEVRQGVVDLVRDAGRNRAHRDQAIIEPHRALEFALLGHVLQRPQQPHHAAVAVLDARHHARDERATCGHRDAHVEVDP